MIVQFARLIMFVAGALGGFWVSSYVDLSETTGFSENIVIILFVILGAAIGYLVGGILGREIGRAFDYAGERLRSLSLSDIVLGTTGLLAGLLAALLVSYPLRLLQPAWLSFLSMVLLFGLMGYGGLTLALTKRVEFACWFDRGEPRDAPGETDEGPKFLDTSAVIDGRFADLRRLALLEGRLAVPGFVLSELQTLADSSDDGKRARGRRGLDLLETLRGSEGEIPVFDADYPGETAVDTKLVRVARDTKGTIVTVDYNLTQVARVQGVRVVNVNEVASVLRPAVHAGDGLRIKIVREGKEDGQGVGYLDDGTMVVVEHASDLIGQEIDIVVSSLFQAAGGRMVFSRVRAER
jgi:uncharacterized protein YacL